MGQSLIYAYSDGRTEIDREYPIGKAPQFVKHQGKRFTRVWSVAPVIPPYMKAPGSTGSSSDACDRQGAYLSSQRHRDDMAQEERIQTRQKKAQDSYQKAFKDAQANFDARQ